ncbi:MAG: YfhO family protein, partial [Thermoanaerobaculia bacterium]
MNWTWAYLAVLYALAIALARRRVEIPWRVAMAGYALVLIFLFRPLTGPTINFAADMIGLIPPWSSEVNVTKFTVSNAGIHDATMQVIPWGQQVRTMWREGTVPLWNALAGCGYPLLANGQSAALSPMRLLALPLPSPYWIAGEAAMKLLVAFTFMFLYLRGRGSSEIASVGGAIAFSLSTYVIVWLHFAIANVAVFTPAIFLAIDRLSSGVSARRIAFAAIVSAFMVFGGHLETVVYIALMTLLYVAWIVVGERIERRGQFLGALVVALVAAFLLAAPFLAPFAEAVTRSQRWSEAARIQFRGVPFSDLPSLVVFLQPRFFGGPRLPWGPMSCETITGFAGILGIAGAAAALFHAASQKQWRDRRLAFVVAAGVAFGIVANWPLLREA